MADKVVLEAEVKSNIGDLNKELDQAVDKTENLKDATQSGTVGFKGMQAAVKGVGTALKAAGIGIAVAVFAKLMEVFSQNQKVVDTFKTTMTALSIAFNDLFKFLDNNIGAVTGYFKSIFEDPRQSIINFGNAIKENLIERFNSLLETFGFIASSVRKLLAGDFTGALDDIKEAGKEYVDVWTGVDGTVDKVTESVEKGRKAIIDYTAGVVDQAKALTNLQKTAELNRVINQGLLEDFDRQAELQRQIRDDETKTFADRLAANEKLGEILKEQEELMLANAAAAVSFAQAQVNMMDNDANQIALLEALNEQKAIQAQITGFQSEQIVNQVALEKELRETQEEVLLSGLSNTELELADLERSYQEKLRMAVKSGMDTTAVTAEFERQKSLIVQEGTMEQLSAYGQLAGALGALAGESKELAVAQAIIDTYVGANKALAQGGILGTVSAAAIIISGLANVKKIMSTDAPSMTGGSSGGIGATPQPPAQQMVSGQFNLEGGTAPEPLQAFVVSDDITNNQDKLAAIRRRATI